MAVTAKFLSMDGYFRFTTGDKLIVNHLTYLDSKDMEVIQNKLMTVYSEESVTTIPSCDCGVTRGRFRIGHECLDCGTTCRDPKDKVDPLLWLEALSDDLKFINPSFWNNLGRALGRGVNHLRWLVDPRFVHPGKIPGYIHILRDTIMDGDRSYQTFLAKLDEIMVYFVNSTELKGKSSYDSLVQLHEDYVNHKSDLLSNYMPIPNKKLFVMENTTKGKYTNLVMGDMLDVISTWLKAASPGITPRQASNYTGSVVAKLAELYVKYYDRYLLSKPGAFRKHVYGTRSHFTFRTVIMASTGKHKHNEVVPPWLVALVTYRPHMMNKLVRRGYSYKDADAMLNKHVFTYHPVLDEIMKELVSESPHEQGLPVIINRNPSLFAGSTQSLFIPRFNNDPHVLGMTFSPLIAKSPNADFDGDELNGKPLLDSVMFNEFKKLAPFYNIPDLSKPCSVSGRLSLDTPNNTILANYLGDKEVKVGDDSLLSELQMHGTGGM